MMRNAVAGIVLTVVLGLTLTACKDTKTLQENEQLKAQVADLQKQDGELGNTVETLTASRDTLAKENEMLKAQVAAQKTRKPVKVKKVAKKAAPRSRRRA